ncbi:MULTISPECIES: alpha/beta fold hydrolase [Citrobacter]|uniref:alpha/beta fold hydrolase n=1 Tax=Citrobacter TaxID=544 RepID=UPI000C1E2427|nr:alpha/beta hydrolase [Citrobacter portucalensis]ATX03250.1 alpha/beta hydrolase [Citrobacter freundii]
MSLMPRTIVLIPGYMLNEMLWHEFETYLPANCIVHHASVTGGLTLHDIAQHMSTCLPDKFTLIGFSLGGYIARQFAADFSDRVESLVLIASSLREDTPLEAESKRQSVQSLSPATFKGLSSNAIARSLHPLNASDRDMISTIQQMGRCLGFEAFITQSTLTRQGIPSATIGCPTLVIASEDDAIRSMQEAEELVDAIPGASLRTIKDCGHMIPLEQPEALARTITEWISVG